MIFVKTSLASHHVTFSVLSRKLIHHCDFGINYHHWSSALNHLPGCSAIQCQNLTVLFWIWTSGHVIRDILVEGGVGKKKWWLSTERVPVFVPLELKSKGCLFPGNTCVCPIGFKTIEILGIPFNDLLEYCN